ncbi:RTN4RL1 [Branchiostoma lanceolatum]|uniref:RTN4RL1 protein n=1 Tax=Branchiostoma lanceolatum TaxID=7740 RepID=A0A8J9ZFU3_BRALA|nr:RTN4RL1 [Branchiostoma lanceolatum]
MEKRSRQCVAILVLLVLKFSLPCPEECFVQYEWKFVKKKNCECPIRRDSGFRASCVLNGIMVAANSVCSAKNDGYSCLNDVPTGFDQSVTGIILNHLFNLTTLTKQHIPPLPNLITFVITGSTIQTIEPGAFSSLPSILSVTIRCSHLLHIGDETFYNLPSLKTIFMNHNLIEALSPRAFIGLNSLDKIFLNDNQLKEVPFDTLSLIRGSTTVARLQVNLENNQISTVLEAGWKKISDTGVTLRLRGNPLDCDGGMRWLVCNATTLASDTDGIISQAGYLQCTSPSELTGYDFKSLNTNSFCSSTQLTTTSPIATTSPFLIAMTSTLPIVMTSTFPPTTLVTTNSGPTQRARKTTSGTMDSSRGLVLEKNINGGQQDGMDYLYIPVGLTAAVICLLGGMAVAVIIYKRHVTREGQNLVHGHHGVIISSQLISNRMYQHSRSTTGDGRDKEVTEDETEEDSARQNPVHKRHGVTINTSELISNRLYKSSGCSINNANSGTGTADETELTPYRTVPFDAINNTLRIEPYSSVNLNDIRNADKDAGTTEVTEQNSELTPYRTVPFDAINNTLRIEPYGSVNLNDISNDLTNVASGGISVSHGSREVQQDDDMEPYAATSLDQIGYL